jgi:hypothetical protein
MAIRKLAEKNPNGEPDLKVLRGFCHDLVAVRRGDISTARLKIEQERLEREREKNGEEVFAQFEKWADNQEVRDCICQNWKSPEERKRRLREIFGLSPEPPEEVSPALSGSNPVKPGKTESDPIQPNPTNFAGSHTTIPKP